MVNMITNVYATYNYDRLRIDKALGFENLITPISTKTKKSKNNVHRIGNPFPGP